MHMCGAAAADDIVQDTFMALLRGPARYDSSRGTVIGYLFGIARHHVAKRLAAAGVELSLDPIDAVDAATGPVAVETPLDVISRVELVAHVREAIRSLPPVYREAIALCELQEIDYATAAAIAQCPIGTIRSRLHRAKAMLTTKLATLYSAPLIESAKRSAR